MSENSSTVRDMTEGIIWRHLINFAFPLFVGNIFQQLYNTVDSVVVGNFVGADALGAVTSTVPIVLTLIGAFVGMSMGSSVVISQYFGAKDVTNLRKSTHTAVVSTIILSLMISAIGYYATPYMLVMMNTPASVLKEAVVYLQIFSLGLGGLMLYNMGAAILRAVGDSKRPLYYLIFASILNIFLDLLFVIKFNYGVAGVAYATILAQLISGLAIFYRLFKSNEVHSLSWSEMKIDAEILKRIIKIGFPAGFQMALTSFSNVFVQAYINAYGAASTAGWGIYARVDAFVTLSTQSMSMSITTFVGQNAGARRPDRIRDGLRACKKISLAISITIITFIYFFAPFIVSLFNRDAEVLRYGVLFMRLNCIFDPFNVLNQTHAGALRGVGDSRTPMLIMLGSFVVFRQIYLFIISRITSTVHFIALGYPVGWIVCCALILLHIKRSGWEKKLGIN
ncbi:MAG: MATE family efflux transporter [Synergistales bacterium]|nr:MATE family efflux transporter [Synergistales bacterium]MDY6404648.1 MATE family efflux transporter [Synergistales bacterium]MDY6410936.1 MATE family efflux transporter [Synergistales bacterium]MDY6415093.1 MATE family efflux transporter [Synergistales bacterium]MDY6422444.1 MATE family efflux transporter [Synergistales bacterium]